MLNNENEKLFEKYKIKDFEHRNEMSTTKKGSIVKRVNNRLYKRMVVQQEKGITLSQEDADNFIQKQLAKLDTPEKTQKKKGEGIFKTTWGEDIFRKNAFLGAEANGRKDFARVNTILKNYIHNQEKKNKEPTEEELNSFLQKQIDNLDKKGFNEASILRRFSIPHVIRTLRMDSEPVILPFVDKESGFDDGSTIMLKISLNELSYKETRELRDVFNSEDDPSGNLLFIEIGKIKYATEDRETEMIAEKASLIAAERAVKEWTKNYKTNTVEINELIKEMEDDYDKYLKILKEKEGIKLEEKKKNTSIKTRYDIILVIIGVITVGYTAWKLYEHFNV